jgi:aspartate racemase
MSLPTEILPDEHMSRLDAEIFKLMAGQEDAASTDIALEMINYLRAKGVDGVIPGCTEIPLLLGVHAEAPDLVNPAALLAEAAVRYAIA